MRRSPAPRSVHPAATLAALVLVAFAPACGDGPAEPAMDVGPSFGKTAADPKASFSLADPGSADALRGDGLAYANGSCGVVATIFLSNGGGDAVMQTDNPKLKARNCGWPRTFTFSHGDVTETSPGSVTVRAIGFMAVGQTITTTMGVRTSAAGSVCGAIRQMSVSAKRDSAATWIVSTPGTTGTCEADGTERSVGAFSLRITAN